MKKILLAIIPLCLISIASSACSTESKINLVYGREVDNTLVDIATYGDLKSKIEDQSNFILAVYTKNGCACWSTFEHMVMEKYNNEKHTLIYKINYNNFFEGETKLDTFGLDIRSDRATISLFKEGTLKYQEVYSEGNKIFTNKDYFAEWLEGKANLPTIFYISKAQLDQKYLGSEKFLINFSRETCPDCSYLNKTALKSFGEKHLDMKSSYIFDVDEIRLDKDGNVQTEIWNAFKDEYGLSNVNNTTYGYNSGYVPTLFLIQPNNGEKISSIKMASVYFNDTIAKNDQSQYYVSKSFYSTTRYSSIEAYAKNVQTNVLEGVVVDDADVVEYNGNYYWTHEGAAKYHAPLMEAFLNYSLEFLK